jgi:hypothetical protein
MINDPAERPNFPMKRLPAVGVQPVVLKTGQIGLLINRRNKVFAMALLEIEVAERFALDLCGLVEKARARRPLM